MQEKSWTSPQGNQLCYHMCPCMYALGDLFAHKNQSGHALTGFWVSYMHYSCTHRYCSIKSVYLVDLCEEDIQR